MPKCSECQSKIDGDNFMVVKRTKGKPSTITRYPTAKVCLNCYDKGSFELADDSELNVFTSESVPDFNITHICTSCSRESQVIADRKAEEIMITTHRCPLCGYVDRLYLKIIKI